MFVIHKTSNLLHVLNLVVNPPSLLLVFIGTRSARIVFNGFLVCLVMRLRRAQDRFYVKTDSFFKWVLNEEQREANSAVKDWNQKNQPSGYGC